MHINKVINFQQLTSNTLTSATALSTSLFGDPKSGDIANALLISIGGSTGAIRYRDDGTAPTSNIGLRLPSGVAPWLYQGDIQRIQFIADAVPGNADVNVAFVRATD